MVDLFESPREVLSSARDHIDDLNARIKAFFDRQPYTRVIDYDSETGQNVHKIRLTAQLPNRLKTVAKDAFSNLRDTLDHAVYASTVSLRPGKSISKTAFPFAHDAMGVHDKLNRELTDIPPEIRSLLESFRPHKTGNQLLWGLNAVRNTKTHRFLIPLGAASVANRLHIINGRVTGPSQIGYSRWDASKNEIEFMRVGRGSELQYKVNISFDVLFGDVAIFGGQPAIRTLKAVSSEVEGILLAIETETARLLQCP